MTPSKIALCALLSAASLFAADPLIGIWKMNVDKSKLVNPARWKGTVVHIEATDNGGRNNFEQPMPDGQRRKWTSVMTYDGKDYPLEGRPGATAATQRIDDFHLRIVYKTDGKETGVLESSISPDGKTITDHFKGIGMSGKPMEEVRVYDKQ